MSRFIKTRGFTLIELMVVIVIIGVLASLAIPRFSEASDKAKVAEAPRILVSFESAYLAGKAELGDSVKSMDDIIFDSAALSSRWFAYSSQNSDGLLRGFQGATKSVIGKINIGDAFS
ncbi:MAG: type II secretion system GspH family protein, partial [Chitinispirillales bacterium]|nr:type II secretion system GspH family protein [Chitinispirillales bacterium]